MNSAGCDSILTLNLTINTINNGVTQNGTLLTSNATGAAYQWLNCPSYIPIVGATNQSYTAIANGDYAVKVTLGNCTDTSLCTTVSGVGINDFDLSDEIKLYPAPASDVLHIAFEKEMKSLHVQITDLSGQLLYSLMKDHSKHIAVSVSNLAKGLYFIFISDGEHTMTRKFIKE